MLMAEFVPMEADITDMDVDTARIRLIELSNMLLALQLQGDISSELYSYLYEQIIWVLQNIVYRIRPKKEPQD